MFYCFHFVIGMAGHSANVTRKRNENRVGVRDGRRERHGRKWEQNGGKEIERKIKRRQLRFIVQF